MSRRYLTLEEATDTLRRGKVVEQFFGLLRVNDQSVVRYLSISFSEGMYVGKLYDHADVGNLRYADIYSFPPFPADLEEDEPNALKHSHDLATLLQEFHADANKLVNAGIIQEEYLALKRS